MAVLRLVRSGNRETVAVLKVLLNRAIDGEVRDMALVFADARGGRHVRVTGRFRHDPAKGVTAGLKLVRVLVDEEEEED